MKQKDASYQKIYILILNLFAKRKRFLVFLFLHGSKHECLEPCNFGIHSEQFFILCKRILFVSILFWCRIPLSFTLLFQETGGEETKCGTKVFFRPQKNEKTKSKTSLLSKNNKQKEKKFLEIHFS